MSDDSRTDWGVPVERALDLLERVAVALERQADVMEADVADVAEEVAEDDTARIVHAYGECLVGMLEVSNTFEKMRGLRELASKMMKHGSKKGSETEAWQR
jgi:hypothetical protein